MYSSSYLKSAVFILLVFLCSTISFAQKNYIQGHILRTPTDSIAGYIDYRNWEKNPNKISFKKTLNENATSYSPLDIYGFTVLDELYLGAIVEAEISDTHTNKLDSSPTLRIQNDTVFLQAIYVGDKSLFYYQNFNGRDNFYIQNGSEFDLLVFKRYLTRANETQVIGVNKLFLGQLKVYLNNCSDISSRLKNVKYNLRSLRNLFVYYNECTNSEVQFRKLKDKTIPEFGLLTGLTSTNIEFKSESFEELVNADYSNSKNASAGIFLNLILPRNQRKWSVYTELQYTHYNVNGHFEDYVNQNQYSIIDTEFGMSFLKLNAMARYKYPIGKMYMFINCGISYGFSVSTTNNKQTYTRFYNSETTKTELALGEIRNDEQGYLFGTGMTYNRFSVEVRYEQGNGMAVYQNLNSVTRKLHFLIGFKLN